MRHASSANAAILDALHVSVNVMKAKIFKKFLEFLGDDQPDDSGARGRDSPESTKSRYLWVFRA